MENNNNRPFKDWSDTEIEAKLRQSRNRSSDFKSGLIEEKVLRKRNMENKYYTPELNEFHVGFEYEVKIFNLDKNKKTEWVKSIWTKFSSFKEQMNVFNDGEKITDITITDSIRVKHLDREDIESLGWTFEENGFTSFIRLQNGYVYNISGAYGTGQDFISIAEINPNAQIKFIFQGKIKNKSELKKLLAQLNIQK